MIVVSRATGGPAYGFGRALTKRGYPPRRKLLGSAVPRYMPLRGAYY
jgi:hypothetical protein